MNFRYCIAIAVMSAIVIASVPAHAADCLPLHLTNSIVMDPVEDNTPLRLPADLNGLPKSVAFELNGDRNFISGETARALKLRVWNDPMDSLPYVVVPQVTLGGARGVDVRFNVLEGPVPEIGLSYTNVMSRGIFRDSDIDLDFGARRLNIFSPDHCESRVVYWPHQALAVVPITVEGRFIDSPSGSVLIPVTLDGHPLKAMIDTNATHTTMDLQLAENEFGFHPDPPQSQSQTAEYSSRFRSLSFDGVAIENPLIGLQPWGRKIVEVRYTRGPSMIIGMDILRHLHVYVAHDERKLYITEAGTGESALFSATKTTPPPEK